MDIYGIPTILRLTILQPETRFMPYIAKYFGALKTDGNGKPTVWSKNVQTFFWGCLLKDSG